MLQLISIFTFYSICCFCCFVVVFVFGLSCNKLRQSTSAATSTASSSATLKIVEIPFTFQHAIRSGLWCMCVCVCVLYTSSRSCCCCWYCCCCGQRRLQAATKQVRRCACDGVHSKNTQTHTHKHTLTVARHEQGNKYSDLLLPLLLFKSKWTIKSEQAWPEWPSQARPSLELKPGPVCG